MGPWEATSTCFLVQGTGFTTGRWKRCSENARLAPARYRPVLPEAARAHDGFPVNLALRFRTGLRHGPQKNPEGKEGGDTYSVGPSVPGAS